MFCPVCVQDAITEVDGSAGNTYCISCGTVLEENAIVSEITFGETSGGAAMVQGSYIGADQARARAPAGYRQKGGGESREQTLQNGRKRIQELAAGLRLPDRLADAGQRYFNLAVNMNFVQGRRTQYVVAACLYSACRMDKTSHMLIDFSDLLQINVFVLGSTYLKLVKELSLQLPSVDPSLYISRFAALLEFGDETQKVAQDAVRLVARMGRDWMHIGRRPAGVCGACLLLAARMNNFRRSITEVVQVVKIADVTLRKRLGEFKDTASGALTVDDFRTLWLDETADPPAFAESQKREKRERERTDELKKREMEADEEEEEEGEGRAAFAELAAQSGSSPQPQASTSKGKDKEGRPSAKALGKRKRKETDVDEDPDDPARLGEEDDDEEDEEEQIDPIPDDPALDELIASEVGLTLESATGKSLTQELDKIQLKRMQTGSAMTNLNNSDRLDNLDESELDMFILTDAEAEAKSRLWMELNKDYLQALADKQTGPDGELRPAVTRRVVRLPVLAESDLDSDNLLGNFQRKRHKPRDSNNALGTNAADATKQMLAKKRFSKKINYAAIDSLFNDTSNGEFEADAPLVGSKHGPSRTGPSKSAVASRAGTPIRAPILIRPPTFGSSRASTPVSGPSRMGSEGPPASKKRKAGVQARPQEEEEAEEVAEPVEEEEPEVEEPEEEEEEEEEEEAAEPGDDWRKMMGGNEDDGEVDYEEEA